MRSTGAAAARLTTPLMGKGILSHLPPPQISKMPRFAWHIGSAFLSALGEGSSLRDVLVNIFIVIN